MLAEVLHEGGGEDVSLIDLLIDLGKRVRVDRPRICWLRFCMRGEERTSS